MYKAVKSMVREGPFFFIKFSFGFGFVLLYTRKGWYLEERFPFQFINSIKAKLFAILILTNARPSCKECTSNFVVSPRIFRKVIQEHGQHICKAYLCFYGERGRLFWMQLPEEETQPSNLCCPAAELCIHWYSKKSPERLVSHM